MGEIADRFATVFRDYVANGVPGSGAHEPDKADIRAIGSLIDQRVAGVLAGIKYYPSAAARDADTSQPSGTLARVEGSSTVYRLGATGWVEDQTFYQGIVQAVQPLIDQAIVATDAAATINALVLNEPSTGLMFRSDGTLGGWAGDTGSWASVQKPALISYNPPPILAQAPGAAGSSDAGGVREGYWFQDTDGTWYIFYGAGNGSLTDGGGPWRPQYAKSTDRGATWTKMGEVPGISLNHGFDSGKWAARDNLFVLKHTDGFYYFHTLTAATVSNNQICGQPYTSDVWKADNINGPYTFVRRTLLSGPAGRFDALDAYASCLVQEGNTWHLFYSATPSSGTNWYVGRATGPSPFGPFTPTGTQVLPDSIRDQDENPEVFWHPKLNKWVMLTNVINAIIGGTDKNKAYFSDSLTDWSNATSHTTQRISPMDGALAIGHARPKRVAPYNVDMDGLGNVPVIFDTDPISGGSGNHIGRKLKYAVLEPTDREMKVQTSGSAGGNISRSLLHSSFVADFCLVSYAGQGSFDFEYRTVTDGNCYRVTFDLGRNTTFGFAATINKIVNGAATLIGISPSASVRAVVGLYHRVTVVVRGQTHHVYVDGELQLSVTDSTYSYGKTMKLKGNGPLNAAVRGFTVRRSNDVVVKGTQPGTAVSIRGVGFVPMAIGTSNGSEMKMTVAHYPASSVEPGFNGFSIYAPADGVWGGDVVDATNGQ